MHSKLRNACLYALLTLFALTALLPFLWMALTSFKPLEEVDKLNPLPSVWHPENYRKVFEQIAFARYYFNSVFIAGWVTFLTVKIFISCCMARMQEKQIIPVSIYRNLISCLSSLDVLQTGRNVKSYTVVWRI